MPTNQEILADAIATIPGWLTYLDEKEAEQDRLLAEIRAAERTGDGGAGTTGRERGTGPLAWLGVGRRSTPASGATDDPPTPTPTDGATLGVPAASSAPRMAQAPTGGAVGAVAVQHPLFVEPTEQPAAPLDASQGRQGLTGGSAAGEVLSAEETSQPAPGSEIEQEFQQALAETLDAELPLEVQEALRSDDPDDVPPALVEAQRQGELPDRLSEATKDMAEVDLRFREAHERYDEERAARGETDPDHDPGQVGPAKTPEAWF